MSITDTPQQRKAKRKVTEALQGNPLGLSFGELMSMTALSKPSLTKTLALIGTIGENGLYTLPSIDTPVDDGEIFVTTPADDGGNETLEQDDGGNETLEQKVQEIVENTPAKKPRNRPFTPNPITGYQVQKGKAKIFLDRKATSKTLTLSLTDLKELVNAVEKAERVA